MSQSQSINNIETYQFLAAEICSEDSPRCFYLLLVDRDWHLNINAAFLDANGSFESPR
jgi:hypothetical protein